MVEAAHVGQTHLRPEAMLMSTEIKASFSEANSIGRIGGDIEIFLNQHISLGITIAHDRHRYSYGFLRAQ